MKETANEVVKANIETTNFEKLKKSLFDKIPMHSFAEIEPYIYMGMGWFGGKCYPENQKESYYNFLVTRDSNDFSDDTLHKVYQVLKNWKVGRSGDFVLEEEEFIQIVKKCESKLRDLQKYTLKDFCDCKKAETIIKIAYEVFKVLSAITSAESKIVAFSKVMHLLLPKLFIPVDRKMTLKFFNSDAITQKGSKQQFDWIMDLLKLAALILSIFSKDFQELSIRTGFPISKLIDFIFIGYEIAKKWPIH